MKRNLGWLRSTYVFAGMVAILLGIIASSQHGIAVGTFLVFSLFVSLGVLSWAKRRGAKRLLWAYLALGTALFGSYLALPGYETFSMPRFFQGLWLASVLFDVGAVAGLGKSLGDRAPWVTYSLAGYTAYALLSLLWSADPLRGLWYLFFVLSGFALIVATAELGKSPEQLGLALQLGPILAAIALLALGMVEIIWDIHLPRSGAVAFRQVLANVPTTFFRNSNDSATAVALVLPFVMLLPMWKPRFRLASVIMSVGLVGELFFTGSRASMLAVGIIVMGLGVIWKPRVRNLTRMALVVLAIWLIPTGVAMVMPRSAASVRAVRRIESLGQLVTEADDQLGQGSFQVRRELIKIGLVQIWQHPLGLGPGNAEVSMQQYVDVTGGVLNPHNMWLEVGMNFGIIGFSLFAIAYFALMYKLLRISLSAQDKLLLYASRASFLSLLGFILGSLSPSSVMTGFSVIWMVWGISVAVVVRSVFDRPCRLTAESGGWK